MSDFEDALRRAMRESATAYQPSDGLAEHVGTSIQRRERQRRRATIGSAAAALLLFIGAVTAISTSLISTRQPRDLAGIAPKRVSPPPSTIPRRGGSPSPTSPPQQQAPPTTPTTAPAGVLPAAPISSGSQAPPVVQVCIRNCTPNVELVALYVDVSPPEVVPVKAAPAPRARPQPTPAALPFTGGDVAGLTVLGVAFVVVGLTLHARSRV